MRLATLADLQRKRPRKRVATLADLQATVREDDLQATLIEHLATSYPRVTAYMTLNGIRLTPSQIRRAKRMGQRKGILDIYLEWEADDGWVEVKVPGYSPSDVSPEQQSFISRQRARGRNAAVVSSIESLDAALSLWGAPRGCAR